ESWVRGTLLVLVLMAAFSCRGPATVEEAELQWEQLTADYLEEWKRFYPTDAVRLGLDQLLADAEDRTLEAIDHWIEFNDHTLGLISDAPTDLSVDLQIDLRLIRNRATAELASWREGQPHLRSPSMYTRVISGLIRIPETPKRVGGTELAAAVEGRIAAVSEVCRAMRAQLQSGERADANGSVRALRASLPALEALGHRFPGAAELAGAAAGEIDSTIAFLEDRLELREDDRDFRLGREEYAKELRLYYDAEITPEEVAERALAEIETVRQIIAEVSAEYWEEAHPQDAMPEDVGELVARVSADMEENRPSTQQESLELFTRFAEESEAFVRDHGIATLPSERTLEIVLTPSSAGPSQRIGFVASAPPFDPSPMTVLSLPTIPDSFPEDEKEDFYRSFNNHFNKAIIIHELFPGHYMQLKIASGNPRQVRTFFPYGPYVEGWATLVEKIALDAGWDDFNKLTYLAHLRKRLENANRAYTSVQVHCFGWSEEQVSRFSEEEALLAPQFAKSLWGRLERSPLQMTSYFMGKDMFTRILDAERQRLGDRFEVRAFTDAILHAGAVPMDMIPALLASSRGGN
ncbi:DUF885 family protein, partial [Gemmatimonadota bacterium]